MTEAEALELAQFINEKFADLKLNACAQSVDIAGTVYWEVLVFVRHPPRNWLTLKLAIDWVNPWKCPGDRDFTPYFLERIGCGSAIENHPHIDFINRMQDETDAKEQP